MATDAPPELSVGCIVKVVGLVKAQALNGKYGMVRRADPRRPGRYEVDFEGTEDGKELVTAAIRRENLVLQDGDEDDDDEAEPLPSQEDEAPAEEQRPLQVGDTVRICGLMSAAARDLNGLLGHLAAYHAESGRWHVKMLSEGGGTKAFKPANLERQEAPQAAPAAALAAEPAGGLLGDAYASDDEGEAGQGEAGEAGEAEGEALEERPLEAGDMVQVCGLVSAAARHLNGLMGQLGAFQAASGRWHVKMLSEGGGTKAFKPENLVRAYVYEEEEYDKGEDEELEDDLAAQDGSYFEGVVPEELQAGAAEGQGEDMSALDANELAAAAMQAELDDDAARLATLNAEIARRRAEGDAAYSSGTSGCSMKVEETIEVPSVAVGFVIGRGGERIKDLSAECGVRMNFSREDDLAATTRALHIRGSQTAVAKAKQFIQEAIDEGLAIYKGGGKGKGKGKRDFRKGGKGGKAFDRVGEGAGGNAGFEQGICKWFAAGFCRNRPRDGACRNGLHSTEAAIKAEADWVAQGPPSGTAGPLTDPSRPILLLLDLEGGGNRDGTDGEDEIIEVPVLSMDPATGREMGRFHRFARPGFWDRNEADMRRRFPAECFNIGTSSVPFPEVVSAMKAWICALLGLQTPAELRSDSFLFVTCGNWDVKTAIPLQCNKPLPGTVDVGTQKLLFSRWSNLKDVFREHYRLSMDRAPTGMRGMLNRLRIPLSGQHHLGMDDVSNLAKILHKLIKEDCKVEPTGEAKNLDLPPNMFGKGKGKGKGKGGKGTWGKDTGFFGGKDKGGFHPFGFSKGLGKDFGKHGMSTAPPMSSWTRVAASAAPAGASVQGAPFGALPKAGPAKRPAPGNVAPEKDEAEEDDYDPFAEEPAPHVSVEKAEGEGAPSEKKRRGLSHFLRGAPVPGQTWEPRGGSDTEESDAGELKPGFLPGDAVAAPRKRKAQAEPEVEDDEVVDAEPEEVGPARPANPPLPWQRSSARSTAAGAGDLAGVFDGDFDGDFAAPPPGEAAGDARGGSATEAPKLSSLFASLPAPRASVG